MGRLKRALGLWLLLAGSAAGGGLNVVGLRCEYLENPLAVDERQPRLSWRVESAERGERQAAYQIVVADSEAALQTGQGILWDSRQVSSDETVNVPYQGKTLSSRQSCFWKVRAWDRSGTPSGWSKPASWKMGLLEAADWKAEYISFRDYTPVHKDPQMLFLPPARQYRKEFQLKGAVRRAILYSTALGIHEVHVNGERVGEDYFAPGWSDYRRRAYYQAHDLTSVLRKGANAIAAWVADGWYAGYVGFGYLTGLGPERIGRYFYGKTPALMLQLEIEYEDGTRETIVTDKSWKVSGDGPIQYADIIMGELYDARKEMAGWSKPGFDDSKWEPAILAAENGHPKAPFYEFQDPVSAGKPEVKGREVDLGFQPPLRLEAYPANPVKHIEEIRPVAMTLTTNGTAIFNLGQNISGVARLKVKGAAGARVTIRYGERLHADGHLMTENLRNARAIDDYILRGDPSGETYTPRFTYHGFQYVELVGYPGKPSLDSIAGLVMHSDTRFTSGFECSDPLVNKLYTNIVWTQRANFFEVPTDCPQRDERLGWMGDAQLFAASAIYNADLGAFYTKWMRDILDAQRPNGVFPSYAPFPYQHEWDFASGWMDAGVIIPWTVYRAYGDTNIIGRCWESMKRFLEWRKAESKNFLGVAHGNNWGDWLALKEVTPVEFVDSTYFALDSQCMADMAIALGKRAEGAEYQKLFENIKSAFNRKYVKADGTLAVDTQTAYSIAIMGDLLPKDSQAGKRLAERVIANGGRLATGLLGTRDLLPALSDSGQNDLAVRVLQCREFPSWGYQVEQGATTVWERWDAFVNGKGYGERTAAPMNSFSHPCLGSVCEWMFSRLAGISSEGAGWKQLVIRPCPPNWRGNGPEDPIHWVKAHYDSIRGRIETAWKREENAFELAVTIPANTSATVYLPARAIVGVSEGGKPLSEAAGVKVLRMEPQRAVLSVESGTYKFRAAL